MAAAEPERDIVRRLSPAFALEDAGSEQDPATGGAPEVSNTALWVAHMRAEEARAENPLIVDPMAERLAGEAGKTYAGEYERATKRLGMTFDPIVRAKYVEDILLSNSGKIMQVVILGAGMDTRSYRMHGLHGSTTVFEVDFQESFDYKQRVLDEIGAKTVCRRVAVPVDFTVTDDKSDAVWHRRLVDAGFDPSQPSIVTIEGLLLYLQQKEVDALLWNISKLCASGSIVVGDAMNAATLRWELMQPLLEFMEEKGSPWVWGYLNTEQWREQWTDLGFTCGNTSMAELTFRYKRPRRVSLPKLFGLGFNITKNRFSGRLYDTPAYSMFLATKG